MSPTHFLAVLAVVSTVSAASLLRTTRASIPSSTNSSVPDSWSTRTAFSRDTKPALLPFVTSRVERVQRPENIYKKTSSRNPSSDTLILSPSENTIDHGIIFPSKRKTKQLGSNRRLSYGGGTPNRSYGSGTIGTAPIIDSFYRQNYGKNAPLDENFDHHEYSPKTTASVRSHTISVTPLRYKIIDMGDPWVKWPPSVGIFGFDPHSRRPFEEETDVQAPYRPDPSQYMIAPLYGYRNRQKFDTDASTAYTDLEKSVIDPFRQYASRDTLPWSVQVGTSLTVKDDGRQSRRRFYVRSQRQTRYDDLSG